MFTVVVASETSAFRCTHLSDRKTLAVHLDAVCLFTSTSSFPFPDCFLFSIEDCQSQRVLFVLEERTGGLVETGEREQRGVW